MSLATGSDVRRRVLHVMGLPVSLAVRGAVGDAAVDEAWVAVEVSLRRADLVFSTYRADSVVSRLNAGTMDLCDAPPEVAEVLAIAERARDESGGAFDVYRLDERGRLLLDPSGVVKGWAVQRASVVLDGLRGADYCLAAGGDMVVRTVGPDSSPWRIGVEDPHAPERLVATVEVRNGGVATSGTAYRGSHVLDPRTGRAPAYFASVTVLAPTLVEADVEATTALVLGEGAAAWLGARPARRGVLVTVDGTASIVG